ncbi:MAG: transcription termination factor NusA [Caldilineaceae bacterium]|jgi:N utilization substance protein A
MSKQLIAGINQVATDKGLDREVIFDAIEAALVSAYKRNYGSIANVTSEVDRVTGDMRVFADREVVEEVLNERTEITEEEAKQHDKAAKLGDVVRVPEEPDNFGRIAAQTAKQVILQRIREAERDTVFENFAHRVGEIINAQVRSTDNASGAVTVMLDDRHEALLSRDEQIPREHLRRGDYIRVYIVDVHKSTRGPVIKLSRTHRNLLRRLMEMEIPEVREGTVEIRAIAREPGARSKAAVVATAPGVDPVGSCVGMRGLRIQNIVNELAGEKIDVVEWSSDLHTYIANALSPAKVNHVLLDDSNSIKTAIVVVPDRQLSLAIGKEGQNARLAAKLTGWRIDIKSDSEAMREGIDELAAQQAREGRSTDLFDVVQRFLEDDKKPQPKTEDLFAKAMQALEEQDSQTPVRDTETQAPVEMPDLPMDRESLDAMWPSMEDLPEEPASVGEALNPEEEPEIVSETQHQDELEINAEASEEEITLAQEPEEEDGITMVDELPEVITADMLRARGNKPIDLDAIEIPAELLAGLELEAEAEDEEEEEELLQEFEKEVQGKSKGKKKAKKTKRRRPAFDDDYDF